MMIRVRDSLFCQRYLQSKCHLRHELCRGTVPNTRHVHQQPWRKAFLLNPGKFYGRILSTVQEGVPVAEGPLKDQVVTATTADAWSLGSAHAKAVGHWFASSTYSRLLMDPISSATSAKRPLTQADLRAACVLMTRAFAGTPEEITMENAMTYAQGILDKTPKGLFLVARLYPEDASLLPPNQDSRLVATVALGFHPDVMQRLPTLFPPDGAAYLSNLAVDAKFRRNGIARALLKASEEATRLTGLPNIYLHVRISDEGAQKLYSSEQYTEVARDPALVQLTHKIRPRIMLRKRV